MTESLKGLFRRLQAGVGELGDALQGDRAERLLDEEIRATDQALREARNDAAALKARRIAAEDVAAAAAAEVRTLEAEIAGLLGKRRRSAARERAGVLLEAKSRAAELVRQAAEDASAEAQLAHLASLLEHKLRRLKHQLGTLRASASIQRAQAAVVQRGAGDAAHPEPALASAARARARGNDGVATPAPARRRGRKSAPAADSIDALLQALDPNAPGRAASRKQK